MLRDELAQALAAFATSTITTLRETLGIEAAFRGSGPAAGACITVAIEVTGDLRSVTWVFPVALARALARQMTGDAPPSLDELAAIELANILTGRGAASLEERGLRIELAVPRIAIGTIAGASVRLLTDVGPVDISFEPRRMAA